ncbi:MAG: hypothetical protein U0930_00680 [Pirellulales bacterium]
MKKFKPFTLGTIQLSKSVGSLALTAPKIEGDQGVEVRMLVLRRVP